MRRDLGKELDRFARKSARRAADEIARLAAGEIREIGGGQTPQPAYASETITAPAINSYRELTNKPLVAGSLSLMRSSDNFRYQSGVDFEEDVALSRFKNLTISSGTSLVATYFYYVSGTGGGVTDHGLLTGLGDDDHPQYALKTDSRFTMGVQRERIGAAETVSVGFEEQLVLYEQLIVDGTLILQGTLRIL